MLRIYKVYEFNLNNKDVVAKTITFSSYPAHVNSWDDFFVASSNLSIMVKYKNRFFIKIIRL